MAVAEECKVGLLDNYLEKVEKEKRSRAAISYLSTLDLLQEKAPVVAGAIIQELKDQRTHLKLIASENFCSLPVQLAMGNLLTDKYAEGIAGRRFYAGCGNVDTVEEEAAALLRKIYGCDHAYVQPHSGADANMIAFWAILQSRVQDKEVERLGKKNLNALTFEEYELVRQKMVSQKVMGMSLNAGGHLTHGYRHNVSAKMMQAVTYDVDPKTEQIDYAALEKQALKEKPAIIIAGFSAYSRRINFAKMREIADLCGATFMVDMAHFSGLVAGGLFKGEENPIPFADIVTSTTHKTLRGPRGGMVLCKSAFAPLIDKGCPMVLGGPLPHVMGAKAVAFKEASQPEFKDYAEQVVKNSRALCETLQKAGVRIVTGGTDNHLIVFEVANRFKISGKQAEEALRRAHITVNRNTVPFDQLGPWITSGVRIGTPAMTTLGMKEAEMEKIGHMIVRLLSSVHAADMKAPCEVDENVLHKIGDEVKELLQAFPLYPEIIL